MRQMVMHLKRFANVVVTLLVAAGLLLAPLAAPVLAAPASGHDMQAMSGDTQAEDMPCCPGETESKDCGSCPFVALCLLNVSLPAPSGAVSPIERHARHSAFAPIDDLLIDGLGAKPPDHPPRADV
ncbi:hypothetical protein [Bradyrhizobium iriomotense]|uniref:DUF2946 domain-containing protein n=1 Tax=Bradyrhizobium iriomotense TaxID=441950 RepID=A0ABQ6ASI5_9BRAD|nr:hypothetical protein [Bradyrhizobium iriomotense]GLR84935.1 hypothetical protein GCM10007857_16450 [Bradyrhizobium iriomotense]